jgi:hypothetical protein
VLGVKTSRLRPTRCIQEVNIISRKDGVGEGLGLGLTQRSKSFHFPGRFHRGFLGEAAFGLVSAFGGMCLGVVREGNSRFPSFAREGQRPGGGLRGTPAQLLALGFGLPDSVVGSCIFPSVGGLSSLC